MSQSSIGGSQDFFQGEDLNAPSPTPVIAILDDEACIRVALERLLRSAGFNIRAHADAADFLSRVSTERPDVLLLDLRMPEIDGFDVLNALRAVGIKLPVIILTAEYSPLTRERAMAAGALAYLIKPVNDQDLFAALSMALAHSKLPSDL